MVSEQIQKVIQLKRRYNTVEPMEKRRLIHIKRVGTGNKSVRPWEKPKMLQL